MRRISTAWLDKAIQDYKEFGKLERTSSFNKAIQALIIRLDSKDIKYKLYNLGAGVKKLTTDTDICPCCKRSN